MKISCWRKKNSSEIKINGHKILIGITFPLIFGISPIGQAQSVQRPWELLQTHLSTNRSLVAQEIDSKYKFPGDSGSVGGQYKTVVNQIRSHGEPERVLSQRTEAGVLGIKMASMDFGIATRLANHPDELFSTANSVELIGEELEDGEAYSILQVQSRLTRGDAPVTAKIWVNKKNSHPLRVKGIIEKVPLPGVKLVNFTITYATDTSGHSLPREITVFYVVSIFFHRGEIFFQHNLGGWQKKPE